MKKMLLIISVAILAMAQFANASTDYNYVSADMLKGWLEKAKPILLVDVQAKKAFAAHHIKGSLETNAFPVKSEADRQLLVPALRLMQTKNYEAVVVVCPSGKGGAKRAYDFLKDKGGSHLFVLTGGMGKWPYREWVEPQ